MAWHARTHTLYGSHTSHNNRHSARRATALYMQGCSVGGGVEGGGVEGGGVEGARAAASRAAASRRRGRRRQGQQWGDEGGGYMYEGGGATRVAATRPEGGGDKCSDVAKGYTCNPNQGRG